MNSGPKKYNKIQRKNIDIRKYNNDHQTILKNNSIHNRYARWNKEINEISKREIELNKTYKEPFIFTKPLYEIVDDSTQSFTVVENIIHSPQDHPIFILLGGACDLLTL